MKKLFSGLLCAVMLMSLCSCKEEMITLDAADVTQPNYNNISGAIGDFWVTGDTVFYPGGGFWDGDDVLYAKTAEKQGPVFDGQAFEDIELGYQIIPLNGYFYFDAAEEWGSDVMFCRMDVTTGEYELLYTVEGVSYLRQNWLCTDEYIAYMTSYSDSDGHSPLYIYDMEAERQVFVAAEVVAFGIADGKLRYLTQTDKHRLYEYDRATGASALLGEFSCYSIMETITYNFTSDSVVLIPENNNNSKDTAEFSIYTISTKTLATYTAPHEMYEFVAGDRFAYAVCYELSEETWDISESELNGIYKIDLSSGEYERLDCGIDRSTELHVTCDDTLYVIKDVNGFGFSSTTVVYKYDSGKLIKAVDY